MRDIFRFCFEQITDPLTLPLNPFWEWIILTFLHEVVYRIAFDKVGVLYRAGIISGRLAGSFLHWLFRGISFVIAWFGINFVIALCRFVAEHWLLIIGIVGGIFLLAAFGVLAYKIMLHNQVTKAIKNI